MKITKGKIREYLGHAPPECRVRITRAGEVHRIGKPFDPFDRSRDYWAYCGTVADIAREMATVQGDMEYEFKA